MNNSFALKLLLFTFLFVCTFSHAKTIHVKNLSLEDGLSQSSVLCILQDHQGFMWFGTEDGLNRYDGYKFTVFRHDPMDSLSISDNHINCLFEDQAGNLWIGTKDGGINRFNPRTGEFKYWKIDEDNSSPLQSNHIQSIYQDHNNIFWFGTLNKGVYSFDAEQNIWKQYQFGEDLGYPQALNTIADICPDLRDTNHLWLATFYGLIHFNMLSGEYSHWKLTEDDQNSLSDNIIWNIESTTIYNKNILLIATNDRLNIFNAETGKFESDFYVNDLGSGIKASRTIYKLRDNQYWIGTMDGVMELTVSNDPVHRYSITKLNIVGLKDNRILSIYQDQSGVIWIGGIIGGLHVYSSKKKKFASWTRDNNDINQSELSNYSIRSFAQTNDGVLWIGTEDKLNKVDLYNNSISYWNPNIKLTGRYTNYYIWSLYPDKNNLWIGTMGLGLYYLNTKNNSYRQWQLTRDVINSINHNFIPCLLLDSGHQLWIGTWGGGLNHYDPEKKEFKHYTNDPENPNSISHNSVWCLFEDSDHQIWIGTYGGGLNQYDRLTEGFKRYEYSIDNIYGISNSTIYCIVEDDDKNLWIGTNGGLNKFDRQTETFSNFTTKDGLSNNVIYGIVIDKNKKLWLSSNNGLMYFDPDSREIRKYTVEEGLQNNEFNAGAYFKTDNNKLIFGGINGLNIFDPDSIQQNKYKPPIVFTDFRLYNQSVQYGPKSLLKVPIEYADKIELKYQDKVFSIDFASLDYNSPEKNIFYYKLEGFDDKWIFAGNRNSATYTNLNPGEYIFRVKGSNNDGVISEHSKSLIISIIPPYWQTIWFNIIVVLAAAALLYWLYRYRLTRVLEMERMRIRIASDLHDDIGSTLTKIAINSEIIQSTQNENKIRESSIKIGRMSREIISSMSDIIWSIDARNDTIKDLLDRMRDFSSTSFAEANIKVSFNDNDLPLTRKIPVQFRQNVFMIFKECLHNILKHAQASEVQITFTSTSGNFRLCINDNGKGFDSTTSYSGNGIKNMKLRASRIHAAITIENNNGTQLCLTGRIPK